MVSTASVRLWASKGVLPARTTAGGHRRFLRRDVEIFAKARGIDPGVDKNEDLKVLVVDNGERMGRNLTALLKGVKGIHSLEVAENSFEAGQKVMCFEPDVVLLDPMRPGLDGIEVCAQLKTGEATRGIRVVAITDSDSKDNVDRILAAGAEACLAKPLKKDTLIDALGLSREAPIR